MADKLGEVNWTVNGTIPNGPSIAASGKINVSSYSVDTIVVPPKEKASANIQSINGEVSLILIRSADPNSYQYLKFALDDSHDQIPFGNGALMLIGGVNSLIGSPKSITIWYNSPDPAPGATMSGAIVSILIGSKTKTS